ncbi:hypothetical protein [Halopseudomonas maritima]|uniref:hypothetical protein n=1 Tax=Halopseudomonas maritima TaxID=2918528 RepID=UPI001EEBC6BD|nr:hypothetical protein [Halopseudomonas maritima]UJJ32776.1 hypothetical protein HV822_06380 [Halopseudomonas maritima]
MSAYQTSTLLLDGIAYQVISGGAFSPSEHGICPYHADTWTPSGYVVTYAVVDGQLILHSVYTNHAPAGADDTATPRFIDNANTLDPFGSEPDDIRTSINSLWPANQPRRKRAAEDCIPPPINGIVPTRLSDDYWHYADINLPLGHSGELHVDRLPPLTGDESPEYIDDMLRAIIDSANGVSGYRLRFEHGELVKQTAEPNEQLDFLLSFRRP